MNCKPGDLAIVVGSSGGHSDANLGRIVSVDGPSTLHVHWWVVSPQGSPLVHGLTGKPLKEAAYPDHALRPLPGPTHEHDVHNERDVPILTPA